MSVALPLLVLSAGCAISPLSAPSPATYGARHIEVTSNGRYIEVGTASWYGPGFHGNRTSSGEVYDSYDLTAAHPSLPLGTRVGVTNLENERTVEVRINDRGPFVKGRSIDLSYAAARALHIVRPGTAEVRIETFPEDDDKPKSVGYSVQAGSFRDADRAESVRRLLAARFDAVYLTPSSADSDVYYRVRVGPYGRREDAWEKAQELSRLGLSALVVEEAP